MAECGLFPPARTTEGVCCEMRQSVAGSEVALFGRGCAIW